MSAPVLDAALQEFASTLDISKAPTSMRCPKCPRLLMNPYKGGCCDTSICETCFANANNACPQCFHTPYNIDTVKPSNSKWKSVKSWLKSEKAKAEQQVATQVDTTEPDNSLQMVVDGSADSVVNDQETVSANIPEQPVMAEAPVPSIEDSEAMDEHQVDKGDTGDDDVEFQVELDPDDPNYEPPHIPEQDHDPFEDRDSYDPFPVQLPPRGQGSEKPRLSAQNSYNSSAEQGMGNNGNGARLGQRNSVTNQFENMQQQMAQMQQMFNSNGFPNLMNMPMGMPMGMNGMNMNMMNPQMFNGFQNNMWQNNNANAFPNGMDFGSPSYSTQPQFPNGDYNQYGRGRGRNRARARGGFGRGRGNFNNNFGNQHNNFNNFQPFQQPIQGQNAFTNHQPRREEPKPSFDIADHAADDDEFAPGGQEEVQEALGEDYAKKEVKEETPPAPEPQALNEDAEDVADTQGMVVEVDATENTEPAAEEIVSVEEPKPIAEAYAEDLDNAMAPPAAPSGPSRFHDKDFGFRSRGQGRFSRNRGSIHLSNGHPPSPVRPSSSQSIPQVEIPGVVGAPTGPRAMREPPPPINRNPSAGFQIMGRASLTPRNSERRSRSRSPLEEDRRASRDNWKEEQNDHDRRSSHRRSGKYDQNGDHEMRDNDESYSRSSSHDRRKSSRKDRDKHESRSTKHDRRSGKDYDRNGHEDDASDPDRDRSHRRERKHHDRERERDRDRDRDRDKPKDRDRDRDRDRAERDREREDRHREKDRERKRRRDRDADDDVDDDYDSSRHKSRRHRKDQESRSTRHTEEKESTTNGTNGRSSSHRSSQAAANAEPASNDDGIDPITRERMERDRQRMLKEEQRRSNAAAALKGSGTARSTATPRRQMSFKYEDEVERGMAEGERERNRGRWR